MSRSARAIPFLLDRTPATSGLPQEIRRAVESDEDSGICDLHIWQVASGKFAAILCLVAHDPKPVEAYRKLFREHEELVRLVLLASSFVTVFGSLPEPKRQPLVRAVSAHKSDLIDLSPVKAGLCPHATRI